MDSYELIEEAKLPVEFTGVGDFEDFMEPDYGND
ncbi:hypothetical protein HEB94_003771 [Actinopolymorpha pittospori]|uniref:Uncharacterized protein n=1 Tax=Actinopolymorpha pittospori TaxID=648752 RepID=A0A927MX62_9ACTN|nr:hypothetical protein [Actinopolymorpha pittospori]